MSKKIDDVMRSQGGSDQIDGVDMDEDADTDEE